MTAGVRGLAARTPSGVRNAAALGRCPIDPPVALKRPAQPAKWERLHRPDEPPRPAVRDVFSTGHEEGPLMWLEVVTAIVGLPLLLLSATGTALFAGSIVMALGLAVLTFPVLLLLIFRIALHVTGKLLVISFVCFVVNRILRRRGLQLAAMRRAGSP